MASFALLLAGHSGFAQQFVTSYAPAAGPTGMALDTVGGVSYLYVADEAHGNVLKLDASTGATVATFGAGSQGSAAGQFGRPYGIAVDPVSHDLYVAERLNGRVQRINPTTGASVMTWGVNDAAFDSTGRNTNGPNPSSPQGHFQEPIGIAADASGNVYVVDHGNDRVQKFLVHQVNGSWTADPVAMWGASGSANGQFDHPYGAALDASGNLWVADGQNGRVEKFDPSGNFLGVIGAKGTAAGQFVIATWVGFDNSGALYVTSTNSHPQSTSAADINSQWVSKFTPSGNSATFVSRFGGTYGTNPGEFRLPFDVVVNASSRAYVSDYYNSRIQVFDLGSGTSSGGTTSGGGTGSGSGTTSSGGTGAGTGTTSGGGTGAGTGTTSGGSTGGTGSSTGSTSGGSNSGSSVSVVSASVPADGTYRAGDALSVAVTFSAPVRLGTATSDSSHGDKEDDDESDLGDGGVYVTWTAVASAGAAADSGRLTYVSGSGTTTLKFKYQVHGNDTAPAGIVLGGLIQSNGVSLVDTAGHLLTGDALKVAWPRNPLPGVILVRANSSNHGSAGEGAGAGSVTGSTSSTVGGTGKSARLVNLSSRLRVAGSDASHAIVVGFVVSGSAPEPVLVRAVGPGLRGFGIADALGDPTLEVRDSAGHVVAANAGWNDDNAVAQAGDRVGAFKLARGSRDSALIATLAPGAYTAVVTSATGSGTALVEVYDATDATALVTPQLVNMSTRGYVDVGGNLIVGFVVRGDAPKRVLVRAVGPGLGSFGVQGPLADPRLQVNDGSGAMIAQNDNWGTPQPTAAGPTPATATEIAAAAVATGAFPLKADSKDAAVLLTLNPGAYTAVVAGAATMAGPALVEVYQVSAP